MPGESAAARLFCSTPDEFTGATASAIASARAGIDEIKNGGQADAITVLDLFDEATAALSNHRDLAGTVAKAHPDQAMRNAADAAEQEIDKVMTYISLDREVYDALAALDVSGEDAQT